MADREKPAPSGIGAGQKIDQDAHLTRPETKPSSPANQPIKATTKQLGPHTFGVFVRDKGVICRVATMSDVGAAHAAAASLNAIFTVAA
jgi:hypothetical protein